MASSHLAEQNMQQSEQYEQQLFSELNMRLEQRALTIIVFGASGHLAKTKTFPALYDLYKKGCLPPSVNIIGYARSALSTAEYHAKVATKLGDITNNKSVSSFLTLNSYCRGQSYDDDDSFEALNDFILQVEDDRFDGRSNRLCYLATPPSVFVPICQRIKRFLYLNEEQNAGGWMRVIVEKPFGKDLQSSNELAVALGQVLDESQLYRIDHYLAKELVQNIIVFRFSNIVWDAIWNRKYVSCVKISMKESAALEGRGGYYDEYGVIRDVFQNHLLQVLTLIAMEHPASLSPEDVRNEKVKVLKCIEPMDERKTIVGQFIGYRDDPSIAKSKNPNSNQITFVQSVLYVNNHRWAGIPFICKCGKALDAKNTQVTIQLKSDGLTLFPTANFNEIVMRLQPNEAIWLKINNKQPGFARFDNAQTHELDLTYNERFANLKLPKAYTRLILDALRGDQSLFVRDDELCESWRIVTGFLNRLERRNADPIKYERGSRGPREADEMAQEFGFRRSVNYSWSSSSNAKQKKACL